MYSTKYVKAKDIDDAATIMASAEDGKFLAGGMTLIPTLKQRLANPDCLVDLSACGLSAIDDDDNAIRIGAMTRHVDVAESALVQKAIPAVADLAGHIGDRQVRNCGTIGGSLANNDPAACYPAALLALGGTVHTQNRSITAEDYFDGMFETTLEEGEIIREVSLPKPEKAAYVKFPNPASRYAMVGVFVAKFADGVRVAVTGAGEDGVFRASNLEAALDANFSADAIADGTVSADGLMSDIHASAEYRAHLIGEMADIEFKDGKFTVTGTDREKSFGEIALSAYVPHNFPHDRLEPGLEETSFYDPLNFTYPSGTHIAEVEIDPATGVVELVDWVCCDDFGNLINPMVVEGQVHGGIAQGVGQALYEEAAYNDNGQLLSASYMDYCMPRADHFPSYEG